MDSLANSIATSSMTHKGSVRTKNEDALLAMPNSGLWAVADGMGGHEAGDYASRHIVTCLEDAARKWQGRDLLGAIPETLTIASRDIYHYSQQHADGQIVGSTATVLVMEDEFYHCLWSGDSRCYLSREQQFRPLTRDHTHAQELISQGFMSAQEAQNIPNADSLTDAIGVSEEPFIERVQDYIYQDDRFLLCTDGVNKVFSDDSLSRLIDNDDIEQINQHILTEALQQGAPDNLTSIIISL